MYFVSWQASRPSVPACPWSPDWFVPPRGRGRLRAGGGAVMSASRASATHLEGVNPCDGAKDFFGADIRIGGDIGQDGGRVVVAGLSICTERLKTAANGRGPDAVQSLCGADEVHNLAHDVRPPGIRSWESSGEGALAPPPFSVR